jgi:CubicO group peptidase (beta-lactamase class C family)
LKKILTILFLILLSGCLSEEAPFRPYRGILPQQLNDGWQITSPAEAGMESFMLDSIFRDIHSREDIWQLRSLTVMRHGSLVAESYLKDADDISNLHPIWSCTKQVMAVLTGIAIQNEIIDSVNALLSDYIPEITEKYPDKSGITIKHLLAMSSGIGWDEGEGNNDILQQRPGNITKYILEKAMRDKPGEKFAYSSADGHLLAIALQNAAGMTLQDWADEVLFGKIGFSNYSWIDYNDYNLGGFGISTTPREIGKIAQFVMNQGLWNGARLLDSAWIEEMTSVHFPLGENSMGYMWWVREGDNSYYMFGSGGQFVFCVPDLELIVIAFSEPDTGGDLVLDFSKFLEIVESIKVSCN